MSGLSRVACTRKECPGNERVTKLGRDTSMLKMHEAVTVTFTTQFKKNTITFTPRWQEVYLYMRSADQ